LLVIDDGDLHAGLISDLVDYLRFDDAGPEIRLLLVRVTGACRRSPRAGSDRIDLPRGCGLRVRRLSGDGGVAVVASRTRLTVRALGVPVG